MTTAKSLAIVALLFGGTSLALAQTAPTTGGSPPAAVTTGLNGAAAYKATTPSAHATKHHKKMYMSAKGSHHKTLKPGQQMPKQQKQ
jgi:hypothetical protein